MVNYLSITGSLSLLALAANAQLEYECPSMRSLVKRQAFVDKRCSDEFLIMAEETIALYPNARQTKALKKNFFKCSEYIETIEKCRYSIHETGPRHSFDWRVYFKDFDQYISPMHDISYKPRNDDTLYNAVIECPRWSNAKNEIVKDESLNPIFQDVKNGALRNVPNVFPHKGYPCNYGAIPQTWESPNEADQFTNAFGDNDPIDLCEIGSRVANIGDVVQVKVLGILGMLDGGETDWKLIAIDVEDEDADQINNLEDVERVKPGFLAAHLEWFRTYKGKPFNEFYLDGEYMDADFAINRIEHTHQFWKEGLNGGMDSKIVWSNRKQVDSDTYVPDEQWTHDIINTRPAFNKNKNAEVDWKAITWMYPHAEEE